MRRGNDGGVVLEGGFGGLVQGFQVESERTYRVRITARVSGERDDKKPGVLVLILGERSASLVISSTEYETHDLIQLSDYEGNPKGCVQLFDYNPNGSLQVKRITLQKIPTDFAACFALIDEDLRESYPFTDSTRTVWDQAVATYAPLAAKAPSELAFRVTVFEALKLLRDPTLELQWELLSDKLDREPTYSPPGATMNQLMDNTDVRKKHWLRLPCGFSILYRGKQN